MHQSSSKQRRRRGITLAFCLLTQLAGWALAEEPPAPTLSLETATRLSPEPIAEPTPDTRIVPGPSHSAQAIPQPASGPSPSMAATLPPPLVRTTPTPSIRIPSPLPSAQPTPLASIAATPKPSPTAQPTPAPIPTPLPTPLPVVVAFPLPLAPTPPLPPAVSAKALAAVAWAKTELQSGDPTWSDQLRAPWSGYCEAFVEIAYGTRYRYPSALANYHAQLARGEIHLDTKPPAGALVFYGGGPYGHVALSIGGGQIITTWGEAGQRFPLHQTTLLALSNPYLGWSYTPYP